MSDDILEMLSGSAAAFARSDPERPRRFRGIAPGFDRSAWTEIAEQGWLSIMVPEARGGLGLGIAPAAAVARELGRAALPEPFVAVGVLAATCLAVAPDREEWNARLTALCAGQSIVAVAWQDAAGDIEFASGGVTASATADGIVLNGVARFVAPGSADAFLVHARGELGGFFWVSADTQGLGIAQEPTADGGTLAILNFVDALLPPSAQLLSASDAAHALRRSLDAALIANAAELLGLMDGALAMTLEYLRTRKQFGVAIGSNQALQHRAVDLWVQVQIIDAALKKAVAVFDDPAESATARSIGASGVKARAAQQSLILCNQALQLHGAIGFADEYGLGLFLNRALTLSAWLGNAAQYRKRFGTLAPIDDREAARGGGSE